MHEIPRENWSRCKICGKTLLEIAKEIGGNGKYYSENFLNHLKEHNIDPKEYFYKYENIETPICPCGICKQKIKICRYGAKLGFPPRQCGRNEGQQKWSVEARITRRGSGNPMYGKQPWNQGLTKETSLSVLSISEKQTGRQTSEETKKKQSESAKKRLVHGHTGCTHSEETKEKCRQSTLKMIKNGDFKQTNTLPHRAFKTLLIDNNIVFEEEKIIKNWTFDFYLIEQDMFVEIDGDYFHSNPKIYKDGPKTKTQKINYYRDKIKNKFCTENNINLTRFWESEVLNKDTKVMEFLCKLKK